MVNEMGNTKSSQRANHGDEVRGRNRTKQGGERKDVHDEKVEGPKGGDPPVAAMRTSDDKEQDDTKLKVSSHPAEVLPIESSNEATQGGMTQPAEVLPMESSNEATQGGMTQPAASPADNLEKEANLEENLVVKNEVEASNSTADTGSDLPGSSNIEEVPQTKDECVALSENNDEVDSSKSGLVMVGSEKENSENTVLMEAAPVMETVPTELPATEGNNEEEEEIKEKKVIEEIEKEVELRKSPSFGFDVSMEGKPGESNQTPLLHQNKNRTRNPSLFDGSKGVEELSQTDEAVSAEEKTIEVAVSDSDRAKGTLQNDVKEEEGKGKVTVEPQKKDCEKKGVEEPKAPAPSPLKKFLCCAA